MISEKDLNQIFKSLYKGDKGNFGLGLSISNKIVHFYHGTIMVELASSFSFASYVKAENAYSHDPVVTSSFEATGQEILKFHVRRDNPPQDGYWFNFRYHTIFHEFQTHHNLGSIYWAKDTPPKWMS